MKTPLISLRRNGHTFHNACLTQVYVQRHLSNVKNGREKYSSFDSDEEFRRIRFREEGTFTVSIDFDGNDDIMESVLDRISLVCEDPIETTSDWVLNRVNGEEVYCVYSLIKSGDSLVRIEFSYNKDQNHLDVEFISHQVFNRNKKYQIIDNWVFKRRANGYFNPNVACRV